MIDEKDLSSEKAAQERAQAADDAAKVRYLGPGDFSVFENAGDYRLTIPDDRTYLQFAAHRTFPLSMPEQYLSLRSGQDEIGIIRDLGELDKHTAAVIRELLARRYFVPRITRILSIKEKHAGTIWNIQTPSGDRTIVTKSIRETLLENSTGCYFVTDVEGNRYGIVLSELPPADAALIESWI